jgi:hypothetical protein
MAIRINNTSFILNNGSFSLFKSPPLFLGQIYRVVNIGGTAGSLSYTAIDGSTASTGNLTTGQIAYILAVSGSMSDGYPVGTGGLLARTNLLITSSIITPPTFTEELITTTGAGTWTKPAGVTEVIVECWGGGGSGGGATANPAAGSGAAGGQYARKFVQYSSPSVGIPYSVAATRAGGTGNGTVGNDTTWNTNVVVAKGGAGGIGDGEPGAEVAGGVGSITSGIGDVVYAGVSGGSSLASNPFNQGGGGGASAGSVGNQTTVELGGSGGSAATFTSANGGAGNNYGAGGGGAYTNVSTNRSGGAGAQGLIRLIYR